MLQLLGGWSQGIPMQEDPEVRKMRHGGPLPQSLRSSGSKVRSVR